MERQRIRAGDVVVVRPINEIMATLDPSGRLDSLPFMPEMLRHVGRRFTVAQRAEKICDTVGPGGSRRLRDAVYLGNLRCDGAAHGGCEQECRLYWKEAWLERVSADGAEESNPPVPEPQVAQALERLSAATRNLDGTYRCQATEAYRASERLKSWWPGQYMRELTCGNIGLVTFLRVGFLAVLRRGLRVVGLDRWIDPPLADIGLHERSEPLGLRPGDLVEIKSPEEIAKTLNSRWQHRGLFFSAAEMMPLAGRRYRVRRRVQRIVDDKTGRMLEMKHDCIVLDGCYCTGELSAGRWFCGRQIFPWWREAWLRRVETGEG